MTVVRILTRDTADHMIRAGNTAAWYAKEEKVANAEYFICVAPGRREPFFLGKVDSTGSVPESGPNRWALYFKKYVRLSADMLALHQDGGGQNPFVTLPQPLDNYLKVSYSELDWQEVPERISNPLQWSFSEGEKKSPKRGLTIAEAKERLAESLGVRVDQIEILIRG